MTTTFAVAKKNCLSSIDLSIKGSIDDKIVNLVNILNSLDVCFTTSSCSGRTVVFVSKREIGKKSKGCEWLFTSHDIVENNAVAQALVNHEGSAVFKFEPAILHIRCSTLADAQILHAICIESNFRNSGITIGRTGKITLAVRSTLSLEVPLSNSGSMLVSKEYVDYIVEQANEKMTENWNNTNRLYEGVKARTSENGTFITISSKKKRSVKFYSDVTIK